MKYIVKVKKNKNVNYFCDTHGGDNACGEKTKS